MATRSSPRLSRLSDRAVVIQRQLITFPIHQTDFLLPLEWVYRAVVFSSEHVHEGQVHFADGCLPLLDVERSLLGETTSTDSFQENLAKINLGREKQSPEPIAGLILQQPGHEPQWVLPLDAAPTLCRIPDDCFVPLPRTYTVQCVKEMTDNSGDHPLHFLIDPSQLLDKAIPVPSEDDPVEATAFSQTSPTSPPTPSAAVAPVAPPASPSADSDSAVPNPASPASSPSTTR